MVRHRQPRFSGKRLTEGCSISFCVAVQGLPSEFATALRQRPGVQTNGPGPSGGFWAGNPLERRLPVIEAMPPGCRPRPHGNLTQIRGGDTPQRSGPRIGDASASLGITRPSGLRQMAVASSSTSQPAAVCSFSSRNSNGIRQWAIPARRKRRAEQVFSTIKCP